MEQKREGWCLCSLLCEYNKLFCVGTFSADFMYKNSCVRPRLQVAVHLGLLSDLHLDLLFYNHKLSNWIAP